VNAKVRVFVPCFDQFHGVLEPRIKLSQQSLLNVFSPDAHPRF
jgi:hypothetical protein